MELLATKDAIEVPTLEIVDRALENGEEDVPEDF